MLKTLYEWQAKISQAENNLQQGYEADQDDFENDKPDDDDSFRAEHTATTTAINE